MTLTALQHPPRITWETTRPSHAKIIYDSRSGIEYIYRHLFKRLHAQASRITCSSEDSKDIVMNVIYKVVTSNTQPQSLEHLKKRLCVSVRNEAISYLRHKVQHRRAVDELCCIYRPADPYSDLFLHEKERFWLRVIDKIHRLSPQRKKVLCLYFFANKSTKQISDQLSISTQTVLNLKSQALRLLRNSITVPFKNQ